MPGLKVVALISGGKDSLFSILHCQANGHEVVALANLHPRTNNGEQFEDVDSFMYQTIGHTVIPLYEKALGLPLYRQEILGSAVDQNKSYATPDTLQSTGDETESLLPLLQRVMAQQPDVNAVSTGAILSDYQRTRVESVATRLGLVPLSYLWQYPFLPPYSETSLLDDMMAVGQDARIIKVASGGLDDSFLWDNVASPRTKARLVRAMERFGIVGDGAALGEGGEFETLAIDGPSPLWKSSIEVPCEDRIVSAGEAGSASLSVKNARLVPKDHVSSQASGITSLRSPSVLDDKFLEVQEKLLATSAEDQSIESGTGSRVLTSSNILNLSSRWLSRTTALGTMVSNAIGEGATAGAQMKSIMSRLVEEFEITPFSIAYTTIILRSMSDFAAVNAAYGAIFTAPSPPARVTVASGDVLPLGVFVSLSIMALAEDSQRHKQGLHVQSRSYWAPANIGPYSQAISVPTGLREAEASIVYVAGQIPLSPASMDFPLKAALSATKHFQLQATLSLQHLWRIGQIMKIGVWLGAVAFIARKSDVSVESRVGTARMAWKLAHTPARNDVSGEEDDDDDNVVDVWDMVHRGNSSFRPSGANSGSLTKRPDIQDDVIPPCFVAEIETLPRNAPIEWASIGLGGYSGRINLEARQGSGLDPSQPFSTQVLTVPTSSDANITSGWISLPDVRILNALPHFDGIPEAAQGSTTYTVYTTEALPEQFTASCGPQIVPCHRIWDSDGKKVAAIVNYRSV
ncbi:hypothetical protein MBLNU459_g0352t1 [Dothideomycetes sp. NU459]